MELHLRLTFLVLISCSSVGVMAASYSHFRPHPAQAPAHDKPEQEVRHEEQTVTSSNPIKCSPCLPGYGVLSECDEFTDTVCSECLFGTYNSRMTTEGPCVKCSTCPELYYERTPCTTVQDIVCLPCFGGSQDEPLVGGFGNEDFLRKCELHTRLQERKTTLNLELHSSTNNEVTLPYITKSATSDEVDEGSGDLTEFVDPEKMSTFHIVNDSTAVTDGPKQTHPPKKPLFVPQIPEIHATTAVNQNDNVTVDLGALGEGGITAASFQWPILLAALTSSVVFFVFGFVISKKCIDKRRQQRQANGKNRNDEARETMMPTPMKNITVEKYKFDEDEEKAHRYIHATQLSMPLQSTPPLIYREPPSPKRPGRDPAQRAWPKTALPGGRRHSLYPFLSALNKYKPVYSSQELAYIDEDSDDEIAHNLGRPPSIHFKEKARRRHSFLASYLRTSMTAPLRDAIKLDTTSELPEHECNLNKKGDQSTGNGGVCGNHNVIPMGKMSSINEESSHHETENDRLYHHPIPTIVIHGY